MSRKTETKMFFMISSIKLRRFWWNLVRSFRNILAANLCKRFFPHQNNVSTLPCETWNAYCVCATIELLMKETPEIIPPQLWHPNSPDLNPFDYSMWRILQEKVYKTRITDLDPLTMPLMNGCCNDDVIRLDPFRSQLLFRFAQISDVCFVHFLLQYSHML